MAQRKSNTQQSNTQHTHTEREQDMAQSKSTQQSPSVEPAWSIPRGYYVTAWSVKGRGKSATYCALMDGQSGAPGQRVALVAKSGAVTLATLTEVRETVDGATRWDFDRVKLTPEQQAANRAAKSASTAAYWSSDAGLQTAERIAQRTAAKSTEPAKSEPAKSKSPSAQPEPEHSEPEQDMATMAAAMRSAGFTAAEVLAALSSAKSEPTASPQPAKSPSPSKSPSKSEPASDALDVCDACNRERRNVKPHSGAPELHTCPRCSTLDADTARVRAERHS